MDANVTDKRYKQFCHFKQQCLSKEDLSRKGSIDEPIRPLVELLNSNQYYYTTSTCSGRISLIEKPHDNAAVKKGGNFLLNSHEQIEFEPFYRLIRSFVEKDDSNTCLWLKFEPYIMHVQCYDLEKAHSLLNAATRSGCRNSGITLGKNDKFLVAVRSTSSMEIPLHCGDRFMLDENYLMFVCDESNRRLRENLSRLESFMNEVEQTLKGQVNSMAT
uniref:tRNA wybutosine-synthesizing protein 3 homolog n=1 Tax=Aceria tosichella TaxID=561515 RepID=A0A6G1S9Y4_9ACAR